MSNHKKTSIGGQALIEGIMMRGPKKTVMAIRKKDGSIEIVPRDIKSLKDKCKIFSLPIIRGVVGFVESMTVGYKAMMDSAELSGYLDEELEEEQNSEEGNGKKENTLLIKCVTIISTVLAVILSVGLFIYLPSFIFKIVNHLLLGAISSWQAVFEGILKILIFVGYMAAVSQMKEIKRVYRYHGAEHKTIFCYEAGLPLTVENIKTQSRFHPRCGTSFMILMLIVSIAVTLMLDLIVPWLKGVLWLRTIIKLLLVPLICGIGYELIKICGRYDNIATRIIAYPGLLLQKLTVYEPDESMIEIAIAAMNEVIPENEEEDKW